MQDSTIDAGKSTLELGQTLEGHIQMGHRINSGGTNSCGTNFGGINYSRTIPVGQIFAGQFLVG